MKKVIFNKCLIAEKLRSLRVARNIDLNETAKELGLDPICLQLFEEGQKLPNIEMMILFCNFYNIKVDELLFYSILS